MINSKDEQLMDRQELISSLDVHLNADIGAGNEDLSEGMIENTNQNDENLKASILRSYLIMYVITILCF